MAGEEVGGIEHARGPCSWDGCGKDGRLAGFGCPGFRPLFWCEVHDLNKRKRPTGFKAHRLKRGIGMREMFQELGWGGADYSSYETGRKRMDRLQLREWWGALNRIIERKSLGTLGVDR